MKATRFGKPDFQEKLARARQYQRKPAPDSRKDRGFWEYALLFIFAVVVYFLTISSVFLVSEAELLSPRPGREQVEMVLALMSKERIFKLIPSNHILFMQETDLLRALQRDIPEVRSVTEFKKKFPDRIELAVEVRQPYYVWQTVTEYYYLDQDGVVFEKIANFIPEQHLETLIVDRTGAQVKAGEKLEPDRIFNFVDQIKGLWPGIVSQTTAASFAVPGLKSQDVFVKTGVGFEVYFDSERNAQKQLENLNLVLNREIKPETYDGLSYIDLRLPTRAYYCYKDAPCAPSAQIPNSK